MFASLTDTLVPHFRRKAIWQKMQQQQLLESQLMHFKHSGIRYFLKPGKLPTLAICTDPPVMLEHYQAFLAASGDRQVFIFEMPGFGYSLPKMGFNFGVVQVAATIEDFLRRLDKGPYVLAFPCIAGFTALEVAQQARDLVVGLVLVQHPSVKDALIWKQGCDPKGILEKPVIGQMALHLLKRKNCHLWFSLALGDKAQTRQYAKPSELAIDNGACFCLASGFQRFITESLPNPKGLDIPGLVIWGEDDKTHRKTDKQSSCNFLKSPEYLLFEDCGHFPDLEQTQRYLNSVESLMANL